VHDDLITLVSGVGADDTDDAVLDCLMRGVSGVRTRME
jgi:hypothetical protein